MSSHNRNPAGKNQHGVALKEDDPYLIELLERYHRQMITSNDEISEKLLSEHGVRMRRATLGFTGGAGTLKLMPALEATQLVLKGMDADPAGRKGVKGMMHHLAMAEGVILPKKFISDIMHMHDEEGFVRRDPGSKKVCRNAKVPLGVHERWSGDGHDKLYRIGFPIWAVVDDGTTAWLDAWVVPSNRMGVIIGYLFLCLVEKYGGMPPQFTTDCGSETTQLYGLVNALQEECHPEYDPQELPAHVYLKSVHNISVELFETGATEHDYNDQDPQQFELCQWLWSRLLRKTLKEFMEYRNAYRSQLDSKKHGPSGMSCNTALSLPHKWGGKNYLLPVDMNLVRELKEALGGKALLNFVSNEFAETCQAAYDSLHVEDLMLENVWYVFKDMLPLVYPQET
ncbi:hypothetical protein DXG01_011655 [Tephrocybe rancida]|nr:hypothetical protein DXG01_011655 [Tephrocybe rancida]